MTTIDCLPDEILEKIVDCVNDFYDQAALSKVSRRFHGIVKPPCMLPTVTLGKLSGRLHVAVSSDPLQLPCSSAWRSRVSASGELTYQRTVSAAQAHSVFESTIIRHVDMRKMLPIFPDAEGLDQLSSLLSKCAVDKITLIFDKRSTFVNPPTLSSFLASIHARHIEFVLIKSADFDPTTPFLREGFIACLVAAGIREVTFSADNINSSISVPYSTSLRLLQSLFISGISRVTVNENSIIKALPQLHHLNCLIDGLNQTGKSLQLSLYQHYGIRIAPEVEGRTLISFGRSTMHEGCYTRADDEQHGRRVEVTEIPADSMQRIDDTRYHISIEYDRAEQA